MWLLGLVMVPVGLVGENDAVSGIGTVFLLVAIVATFLRRMVKTFQ